jgi:hypothetical protein
MGRGQVFSLLLAVILCTAAKLGLLHIRPLGAWSWRDLLPAGHVQDSSSDIGRHAAAMDENYSCSREQALDIACCPCTTAVVAKATSEYFKERLQQLVETPMFRVYTPYPDHAGKELYDVQCSIPEFRELALDLSEAQLGCAIEQCGCSHAGECAAGDEWRLQPCFTQCGEEEEVARQQEREKGIMKKLSSATPLSGGISGGPVQYDLIENPEQFTGYGTLLDDKSAGMIWANLYSDSFCFTSCSAEADAEPSPEKRLVYKVVSGLQASINTHIAMNYGFYNETQEPATRENWGLPRDLHFRPWRKLFEERVGRYPDRLKNMHFVFALLARALHRLEPHLDRLLEAGAEACSRCAFHHNHTRELLRQLVAPTSEHAPNECLTLLQAFDDKVLFRAQEHPAAGTAKRLKDEVRVRFQRIGDMMTCVGCDRCKLWGSLQFHATRVALGILLDFEASDAKEGSPFAVPQIADLRPNDIVALVNAMAQVSKSIDQATKWSQPEQMETWALEG